MKTKLLLIFLFSGTLLSAQQIARVEQVEIQSHVLEQSRPLLIYTPQLYDENRLVSYNVIYVFDAQNRALFDLVHALISFTDLGRRYIVVGITSPYYEDTDYARNHDYLPEPRHVPRETFFGGYCCNSANLKKFVQEEVEPYIRSNYRTTSHKVGIGHSLSASFILDFMLTHDFFNAYLAVSPNFAYDKAALAASLLSFDFKSVKGNRFLYLSHAGENWTGWVESREKVYAFLHDKNAVPATLTVDTAAFPDEDHWYGYLPALKQGLQRYFQFEQVQQQVFSEETYPVKIRVKVPDPANEVFITGNQEGLGNWEPARVRMEKISDYEREIELELRAPACILFTRGEQESQAIVKQVYIGEAITLDLMAKNRFEFEIEGWFDEE